MACSVNNKPGELDTSECVREVKVSSQDSSGYGADKLTDGNDGSRWVTASNTPPPHWVRMWMRQYVSVHHISVRVGGWNINYVPRVMELWGGHTVNDMRLVSTVRVSEDKALHWVNLLDVNVTPEQRLYNVWEVRVTEMYGKGEGCVMWGLRVTGDDVRQVPPPPSVHQLSERMEKFESRISGVQNAMESRVASIEKKMESNVANVEKKMERKVTNVENAMESQVASIEKKMESNTANVEKKMERKVANIENAMESRVASLEKKMDNVANVVKTMESRVAKVENTMESRVASIEKTMETKVAKVENTMESRVAKVENTIESKVANVENAMEGRVANVEIAMESRVANVEKTMGSKVANVENAMESQVASVEKTMEGKVANVENTMERKVANVENTMEGRVANVENTMESRVANVENTMESRVANVENTMESRVASIESAIMEYVHKVSEMSGAEALKQACSGLFQDNVTVTAENYVKLYHTALNLSSGTLQTNVEKFVLHNLKDCLKSPSVIHLSLESFLHLFSTDNLRNLDAADEVVLYEAIIRWVKAESFHEEIRARCEERLTCLEKLMHLVKFINIDKDYLMHHVMTEGIVRSNEGVMREVEKFLPGRR